MSRRVSPMASLRWTLLACLSLASGLGCGAERGDVVLSKGPIQSCGKAEVEGRPSGEACAFSTPGLSSGILTYACGINSGDPCVRPKFACDASGRLVASETTLLDCTAEIPPPDPEDPVLNPSPEATFHSSAVADWESCADALADGASGDTCSGDWVCGRPTDDPCCVELAECLGSLSDGDGARDLVRSRICQTGCEAMDATAGTPAVNCEDAYAGVLRAGQPCEGSFLCLDEVPGGAELTIFDLGESTYEGPEDAFGGGQVVLHWCGGGVVRTGLP